MKLIELIKMYKINAVFILFLAIFFGSERVTAQSSSECLSLSQIRQIHNSDPSSIHQILDPKHWSLTYRQREAHLTMGNDTIRCQVAKWDYNGDKEPASLYVYSNEKHNIIKLESTSDCYDALLSAVRSDPGQTMVYTDNAEEEKIFRKQDSTYTVFLNDERASSEHIVYYYNVDQVVEMITESDMLNLSGDRSYGENRTMVYPVSIDYHNANSDRNVAQARSSREQNQSDRSQDTLNRNNRATETGFPQTSDRNPQSRSTMSQNTQQQTQRNDTTKQNGQNRNMSTQQQTSQSQRFDQQAQAQSRTMQNQSQIQQSGMTTNGTAGNNRQDQSFDRQNQNQTDRMDNSYNNQQIPQARTMRDQNQMQQQEMYPDQQQNQYRGQQGQGQMNQSNNQYNDQYPQARNMQQQPMNMQQGTYSDQQQNQYRGQEGQGQMNPSNNQYNDQYPQVRNMQQQPMNTQQGMYPDQQQNQYRQQGQAQMNQNTNQYNDQYPQARSMQQQLMNTQQGMYPDQQQNQYRQQGQNQMNQNTNQYNDQYPQARNMQQQPMNTQQGMYPDQQQQGQNQMNQSSNQYNNQYPQARNMQQQPMNMQQGMYPDQQQHQYRGQQGQGQMNQSNNQYNDQYPQARNMQQQPMNTQQGMYPDQQQNQYRDQQGQNQMNQSSNQYNDQYPQARNMQQQPMNMQQGMYPDQQQHQYRGQQGQGQMNNQGDYERYYGQYPQYRNVSDQDRYIYASGNFRRDTMNYGQEMAPRTMRSESSMENVIFRPQAGDSEELNQYWAMSRPDYVQERESLGDSSDYDSRYYQFPSDPSMGARSMRQDNRQDMSPHSQDNQYQPWQSYNQSYPERGMDSRYVSEHSMRMMDQDLERSRMIAQQRSSAMGSSAESSYMDYNQTVLDKIDQMRDDFKSSRVDLLTRIGESLYDQAEYSAANAVFTEILAIDSANPNAKVRVAQTDAKNKVMLVRSSRVYDYKLLNPASYRNILDQLKKEMDRYALQYPKGEVVFDVNLRFDTMGINRSTYSFDKADVDGVSKRRVKKDFTYFLRDMTKNSALTPSMKEGIKVSSQADLHVDVAWQTKEVIFKVNDSRMKLKTDSEFPRDIAAITNYLDRYDQPNGKYTFALRQKTISKMTYTDIDLVKFNTVGPEAMLYSMLVPGLGNIVATQGEKGWISLSTFFLFGGAGLAAHLLANDQNKRANNYPEGSQEYQNHKDNSKYLRYGSYACFGVSGVVYLADVFTALGRGIKNMRESKELRRSLRDNVIDVQRESIAIY